MGESPGPSQAVLPAPRRPHVASRRTAELMAHLTRRQLKSLHRLTLLGWAWPLLRQLAQLGVLVFLFSEVLDLGIEDYALFVFSGLIVWTWFSTGLSDATVAIQRARHLVQTPRFPVSALPLVAVAATAVDLVVALPVLLTMAAVEGRLEATALLLPLLLALQFALMAGLALGLAAAHVMVRDTINVVSMALMLGFYATPIFYGARNVPDRFHWILDVNPVTAQVQAVRAVVLDGRLPAAGDLLTLAAAAALFGLAGWLVFRRLEPRFVDEL